MNELLPCPFCGGKVAIRSVGLGGLAGVTGLEVDCTCGISFEIESDELVTGPSGLSYQLGMTAVQKWNRRTEL